MKTDGTDNQLRMLSQKRQLLVAISTLMVTASLTIFVLVFMELKVSDPSGFLYSILGSLLGGIVSMASFYTFVASKKELVEVFISSSEKDQDKVLEIEKFLTMWGVRVIDSKNAIMIGDDISKSVEKAISNSDSIILILSRSAIDSGWVNRELRLAQEKGKRIYPVLIEDVPIPQELARIKFADLRSHPKEQLHMLVTAIRKNVHREVEPPELLQ